MIDAAGFLAFGAQDVQAADASNFVVVARGVGFIAGKNLTPLIGGHGVLVAGVIPERTIGVVHVGAHLALRGAQRLGNSLLHTFLLRHEFRIAAKKNVGTAAGHVGGDSDHAFASGLRNDFSFALVILGIQDDVLDSLLLQQFGEP